MDLIVFILVNLLGVLICSFLLTLISSEKTNNFIEKIPSLIRCFLVPIYAFIVLALCEAVLRFATEGLSIFWSNQDGEFNILITGYILIPLIGAYGLAWGSYLMAPYYKVNTVILIGGAYMLYIMNVFLIGGFASDVIVERITQSNEVSLFSSLLITSFTALGVWLGVRSAKNNSFWAFMN